jgi:hypothetical protein
MYPASLGPVIRCLSGLAALGFRLHHFGDGWVIAARRVGEEEAEVIEASARSSRT